MWSQLATSNSHVSFACMGFSFLVIQSVAMILKAKLDLSEVVLATFAGLILGPHCLNWFSPNEWVQDEQKLTFELCRLIMNIQIFSASTFLPAKYVIHNKMSLSVMLIIVMIVGYLLNSLFVWGLLPQLRWIESLVIAGAITATDPVLCSAVLAGPGFAETVPENLKQLLSAESASNDGLAVPFVMLPVYILSFEHHSGEIAKDFIVLTVLYEVIFSLGLGLVIGGISYYVFKLSGRYMHVPAESLIIYNITVAVFCAGVGSLLGTDDFLTSFAAGISFGWTGWPHKMSCGVDVPEFLDALLNSAFFIYFGAIVPWEKFNSSDIPVWRLIVIAILVLVGRRIPVITLVKPVVRELKSWRDVVIAGHFGPIGVAAIYMSISARDSLNEINHRGSPYFIDAIWPLVSFLVLVSVFVHGSSATFYLAFNSIYKRFKNGGKREGAKEIYYMNETNL